MIPVGFRGATDVHYINQEEVQSIVSYWVDEDGEI